MREPTVAVAPVSEMISGTSSVPSSLSRFAAASSSAARSSAGVADHAGNASCAARAASCACATDASGASPTTSSVAGFTIGAVPASPATSSPPIRSFHSWCCQSAIAFPLLRLVRSVDSAAPSRLRQRRRFVWFGRSTPRRRPASGNGAASSRVAS